MGYHEDQRKAADAERLRVRMGKATERDLYTISGNMAFKAQQASRPKPVASSWAPTPTFPTYPTSGSAGPNLSGGNFDASPVTSRSSGGRVRTARPHTPGWSDRAMQRIPKWVLMCCSILGALCGLGYGVQAGAGLLSVGTALLGAGAGMLALPLLIKLTDIALRVLAFAAIIGGALFIIWQFSQHAK